MKTDIIEKECNLFRSIISNIPKSEFSECSQLRISTFPNGCCSDASELLATYLIYKNIKPCYYISGEYGGWNNEIETHAWLSYDSIIIDITSDQFNDKGYKQPDVYVGKQEKFHDSFNILKKREGGIYYWENKIPRIFNYLKKDYQIIMKEMNLNI